MAVTTIINPLFNLALIPLTQHQYGNGAIGAAISLLLTEIVVVAAGIWLIGRRVFDGGSVRRAALGLAAAIAAGVAAYLSEAMIGWILAAGIGVLVFAGAAALLRVFTPGEVELLRQGVQKVLRRIPGLKGSGPAARPGETLS
jgi:O-antigen/teichoic acid export membrane protein